MQYKKFGENFLLGKKLPNQKLNSEKTLYFEKNLLRKSKMKTKYFIKKQTWKKIMKLEKLLVTLIPISTFIIFTKFDIYNYR